MSTNVPPDMKAFNQKVIEEFRANGGRLSGQLAKSRVLLLTTTGRKSGRQRTTVVGYRMDGDRYLMIASGNGSPTEPAWCLNLLGQPSATVEVGPEKFGARARVAQPQERAELAQKIDYLEQQQALTKREIPIVVLERV